MNTIPEKRDKLFIQTFREIRRYMIVNNLQPGDLLPTEAEMTRQLGVSRNVLREAIKSMELMGMVTSCPGRGTEVRAFNLDFIFQNVLFFNMGQEDKTVNEMLAMRKLLELSYMRSAFHALGEADVARIAALAEDMGERVRHGESFAKEDKDFHMSLFRPLNNTVLLSMLEAIWTVDDGFGLESRMTQRNQAVENHRDIAKALQEHNYGAFARAMETHFSTGKYQAAEPYDLG